MSWLGFIWSNMWRRKVRVIFTLLSIILAFLMFGMLDALRTSLTQAVNLTGADRLITISKVSIIDSFPVSHYEKVQRGRRAWPRSCTSTGSAASTRTARRRSRSSRSTSMNSSRSIRK